MKIVINKCYGGFGLSDAAYEKLIEYGIPARAYQEETRAPETGLYRRQPGNEGEIIFDDSLAKMPRRIALLGGRYWDTWTRGNRTHPLLVRAVEELGSAASGRFADLAVVEVPDGISWELDEYDGIETIAETHRTWS